MANAITDFPVVTPTAEEKAAYESQFGPAPLNPIRDLSAPELADLASADKENFELVSAFRQNKDLWADQNIVRKVADAHNLIKQRGFSLSDLPTPKRAVGMAWDVAKGFGKQLWNYGSASVETAMGIGADLTGQEGIARELEQQAQRRVAENIAGSEQALFGLAEMGERAIQKGAREVGVAKSLEAKTPQEKISDLWKAVGTGETQEDIGRGAGGFLQPVGGEVIAELAAAGKPVRPEETTALAAGDPFSFYLFGKALGPLGRIGAVPILSRAGARVAAGAEKAAGGITQAAGKLTELGGQALQVAGKAAPVASAVGAAISGEPISALAIVGGGTAAGRTAQVVGKTVQRAGQTVQEIGRQVSGKPIVSATAQGIKDVAGALPGAVGEIVSGTAADLGLAAVSSETPQQTESAVGIGTVLGAAGGAKRIAGRVISGQLIAPREYGVATPTASSGNFPRFDQMHSAAYSSAPPGVRARLNAVRQFASGAKVNTDVFLAPDAPTLERALLDSGVDAATAKTFSQQEGFFTTSLPDRAGNPRRVIIARNVEATPHESFHAFQDVLGEAANLELDALVRSEYGPQWDAEGTRYAQRLVGDLGNRAWEEVILDESGWGLDAAKEKIFREVYNMVESETGSAPPDAHVRDLADPELVRIFNEAQSRNPAARPEQFWREILSPEEAKSEADRYIARELAAENFDAAFKQRGAGLGPVAGILPRLSRVIGNVVSVLGGEPLAGRRTEIGQIEPRFRVAERVAELAQGDAQPTTPRGDVQPATPVPPRGSLPSSPEGRQQVADEARAFAEQAPAEPVIGGTRSPRELLGQIAEAIAQQAGVRINYLSAPGEPAAATTSNRTVRREIIEAFRTMPQAARSLWEKSFFPERVRKTNKGFQVEGWAPEVFAANAHKLARTLSELPGGERLTPYPLDIANKTFTDAGWQQLFADTQNFVRNQMAGQTGAGEPLVVPRDLTERGFFAPQSTPARAVDLAQPQADTINMLFNLRLPDSNRVGQRLPLNIAGQEVSIATAGGPQRLSVPVEPRPQFSGERAQALGIEGRSILEVNPVRSAIEQAAAQAKVALPSFIEAIQKLNLENIKEVELAPELPQFRGNTLTLTAGFQPSADPRAVKAAAVKDNETGRVFEGSWHGIATDNMAYELGISPDAAFGRVTDGFTTNSGEFLTRDEAFDRALALKQVPTEIKRAPAGKKGYLEADEFEGFRQFQPVAESARRLTEMTPEEWKATIGNYKGKLGAGLTGWAWDLGASAKTFEDVQALRSTSEALREASKSGDFSQRMELIGRAQAAREAYEAATGRNLEDTNDGSAVPGIRKYVDPNYNPPVPLFPENVQKVLAAHQAGGGSTFNLSQNRNLSGEPFFAVSTHPERSKIIDGPPTASDINEYIRANQELLAQPENSLGTWTNKGKTYLDVVTTEPNRERAIQLGRDNNQIAIFDLQKFEEIPTGGTGEVAAQFQPAPEDFKLRKPAAGGMFSKAWILPDGTPVQLGGKWHHEWLNENGEQYGIKTGADDPSARTEALKKGFARMNYARNGGQLTVEARAADWAKLKPSIQQFVETNIDQIDNLRVELFNDDVSAVADSGSARFMNMNSDMEKMAAIPFLESAPIGGAASGSVTGIAQARARQFQPGEEEYIKNFFSAPTKSKVTPDGLPFIEAGKEKYDSAWVMPDGRAYKVKSDADALLYHDDTVENFFDEGILTGIDEFQDTTGAMRVSITDTSSGIDDFGGHIGVSISKKPTSSQIDYLRSLLHEDSTLSIAVDITDKDGNVKAASVFRNRGKITEGQMSRFLKNPFEKTQFQPGAEETQQEFGGMPAGSRPFLSTSQLASMSRAELMAHFPEAIVPKRSADSIPSKLREAPLITDSDNPVQTYADKLAEFGRSVETTPEYQMGRKWYSEFSEQLKARFGDDARMFAELLAATSPKTSVETNFKFALDALEGFKSGRFKQNIKKFEQGLSMMANDKWLAWYNRELNAGRISDPPAKPTPAAFMARWIETHDIKPRQSNGKLFGINSIPVLQVAARRWLEQNKGPKVANFVENLLGEGTEATIDLWADRTLRRLGYSDFQERWRIMPVNKQGVSDEDFAFAQSIFRNAAGQLNMKPSELQAAVWFAEKQKWASEGWSRLDLGDFRAELKKTEALQKEIRSRGQKKVETSEFAFVEPRVTR